MSQSASSNPKARERNNAYSSSRSRDAAKNLAETFVGSESDMKWVSKMFGEKISCSELLERKEEIQRFQRHILEAEKSSGLSVTEIKVINRAMLWEKLVQDEQRDGRSKS